MTKEELVTLEVFGTILDKPCYVVNMTLEFDSSTITEMVEVYSKLYYKAFCYRNHFPYDDTLPIKDYVDFMRKEKIKETYK